MFSVTRLTLSILFQVTLFLKSKQNVSGQRLEVARWLTSMAIGWYDAGLNKLTPWYQKCIENQGNYV